MIQNLTVNLNLAGGFNGDLYGYLVHTTPGGTGFSVLLNRVGRTTLAGAGSAGFSDAGFNVTLSDAAATDIHVTGTGASPVLGTFQPDGRNIDPTLAVTATARTTLLSSFNGLSAKGTWTLFLADLSGGAVSNLASWSINLAGISGPFFWKGGTNTSWSNATGANWATDAGGLTNILATPDATEDVIFSTTAAGNRTTALGADFTIKSLTVNDPNAVQINGANMLTISGTGINVANTAGAVGIGANVTLVNAADTVTVGNAAGLTIGGTVSGANGLTKLGTGTLFLGGVNNYTGATNVTAGTLSLNGGANTPAGSTVNIGTAGTLAGTGTVSGSATVTGSGIVNFGVGGQIAGTLGVTGGNWNGAGTVGSNVNVTSGALTIGSGANLTTSGTVNVSGAATISAAAANSTITGNVNVTSTANVSYSGTIAGAASTVTVNNPGVGTAFTLGGVNTYGGLTTVSGGVLVLANFSGLGGTGTGTLVQSGGALVINTGVAVVAEPLTINGAGSANFTTTNAALAGLAGSSFAGPITLGSNATIGAGAGANFTLSGGISKSATTLTFTTTGGASNGVINITTAGLTGAAAGSDLIVESVTVNEGVANSYNGPTFIRSTNAAGSGILNANVLNALPTLNGRTAVTLDDSTSLGGSKLNLATAQSVASLAGPFANSLVNEGANTLTIGSPVAGTTTYAGVITGAGSGGVSIVKDGVSTQVMSGLNTYTGATNVNGGTLRAGIASAGASGGAFGIAPVVNVGSGGTLDLGGFNNTINALSGAAGGFLDNSGAPVALLTVGDATNTTFAGIIENTGSPLSITKVGAGTLTLAGVNTYTGATIVSAGILEVTVSAGNTPLGSPIQGTTVNAGAALRLQSNATTGAEPLTLNGNGIGGVGGALVVLPGTSIIGGPVTLGGAAGSTTTITAGAATTLIFSGGINKDARTLVFDGRGGGQFLVNTNPISGATSFTSDFVVNGGTTTFNTQNSYAGPTWIGNGGTLNANVVGALPAPAADGGIAGIRTLVVLDPDTLANFPGAPASLVPPGSTAASTLNLGANQAIQSLASANTVGIGQASFVSLGNNRLTIGTGAGSTTFFGVIGGGALGSLVKDGASTQILAGSNTYNGPTTVQGGHLQIGTGGIAGTPGNLSGASAVTVNPLAFLDLNLGNNATFANNVSNSGTVQGINVAGNTQTVSGVITGTGNFLQNAGGTTIFTNINTYQAGTAITAASTVQVGSGAQQGSLGTGAVSVSGGSTLRLINVNGNVLPNNVSNTVGGAGTVISTPANAVTTTISGALTDSGGGSTLALNHNGTGTTILTNAANNYSGNTSVSVGTLQVGALGNPSLAGSNVAANTIAVGNAGILSLVNVSGGTLNNNVTNTLGATGTVNANSIPNLTLAGALSGGANTLVLTQTGAGTTTLTNATNNINGGTTVSAGGLTIGTGVLASRFDTAGTSSVNVGMGGVLTLVNLVGNALANNIGNTLGGAGSVVVNSANSNTLSGILSNAAGTLSLTQSGTGAGVTTTLTGANTYTGATLVSAGTLQIGNGVAVGASTANSVSTTVNLGATLAINLLGSESFTNNVLNNGAVNAISANNQFVSGVISGNGVLNKSGAGITALTGNNTYAGVTTITAGVLQVGGLTTGSLGSGAVTNNATLNFTRSDTTTVANLISGSGLLQQFGTGTVILTAANNYTGNTGVLFGTLQIGNGVAVGSSIATSALTTVNLGATLAINLANGETFTNNVTDNGAVNGISANTQTLSGIISGPGGGGVFNQNGTGRTILTGANTYDGLTTINAGTLQVGAGGAVGTLGSGGVVDNAALVINRSNAITIANAISGTGTLTQQGGGTTTLTGANLYTGATNVTAGTLQVGNGTSGNITSSPINVSGGATLGVNLATTQTLGGNIVNAGTINANIAAGTQTFGGNISGGGVFTQSGAGTTFLTGASTYTGATNVNAGKLLVNGSLGATTVTVASGATLGGSGIIGGPVSILGGGILSPGNSPGTITVASLTLTNAGGGSNSNFELNVPGVIGQAVLPGNDLVNVTGNLTLAGNINVTQNPTISAGSYRLFNYGGVLTNNGTIITVAPAAGGLSEQLVFGVAGQVNLLVLNSAALGITQFWDGAHVNGTTIEGGTASWDNFNNNWTNAAGTTNASWQNGVANFGAVAGTVTLVDNINAQGLVFGTTGYVIQGSGAFTLNLVGGAAPAPFITVTGGLTATINAPITGSAGLTSNGGGTLVLTNAANAYTGGTTITGGGAVSIAADGALGATGVGNGVTLNGGSLMATATFASARTVALAGIGTVDVTNANVLTLSGIISGAAGNTLTKVDTGTLNLTGANTFSGGTAIVAGTVQITNDGNLGNTIGGVTFGGLAGGNATLQTLGAVTSARAITLGTGGGTFDSNGFASTLSGIIGGAAGNPLTKIGAGTLTVTGASTYLGQTNVNAGTLQVGDGATAGTKIGNNLAASTVVVGNGGTLAINLPAANTFANNVTNNFGGVINAISAANSQTMSGAISGAGVFNQNGAGTTILTGANSYTGATNVLLGHLQIGDGTSGNLNIGTAVSVSGGAFLDLNLANNATFGPSNITDSGTIQGINTVGNTQTVSGTISGGGAFAQTGAGTTIFTGVNTFAGGTTINNAGIVQVGTAAITGALGSGAVTIGNAGGTLNLVNVSGNTLASNVAGTGGTDTVNVNSVNTNTLSGAYTGTLALNQIGAGTTILTNAGNTYTAGTKVSLGTLQVGTAGQAGSIGNNLAANTIVVGTGGTLTIVNLATPADNPLLNNITNNLGGAGLVNANSANTITLGGSLTNTVGTLALTQSGTGTTILTNAGNTFTGATTVNAGILQIGTAVNAGSLGSANVAVTTGGILSLINVGGPVAGTFSNNVSNGLLGSGSVNAGGTTPLLISGILSNGAAGTLALTQSGTGTTTLTGANTYTGATTVSAGTLQVGNGTIGSIAGGSAVTVTAPGVLDVNLATGGIFANTVLNNGVVRGINANGTTETFSGVIGGSGLFSQISGTAIFTNVNSYAGVTNITGPSTLLQIGTLGSAASAGVGTINVGGGSTLQLVNVNGSTLSNNVTNSAGGGAGTVLSTSALTTTLSGTLTDGAGTLALTQNGSGTTILANAGNTFTGLTTVSAGTLQLGTNALAGSLGGGATIKVGTGGTLSLVNIGNPGTLSNASITNTLGGVGTFNVASNNNNTILSQLTDGGPGTLQLTQTGLGTTTLLGANTYTGTTLISAGILQVGNGGAAGALGTGAVTDNTSLIFNRSDTITVANAIGGPGSLTQQGAGTTILTGANTYGTTLINAGTLQIGAGGTAGSLGSGTVTDNGALVFNRSDAITVANAINGSGTLTQQGTGNTNLTGVSAYTGATTVAGGTLRVNGSLGNTAVTVQSGATLGGNGSIAGPVSILAGGNLAPGNSPGTITVGSLTLVSGSNSNFELGVPGVIGQVALPGNDLVNVTSNLTLAGNINVTQLAGFGAGSFRLFNYGGVLTNNATVVTGVGGPTYSTQIITGVPNQVNLLVLNANALGLVQNWDGPHADNTTIEGGNGTWDGFQNNWTNNAGTVNAAWQNGIANFGGATGTVTLVSPIFAQGLVFSTTGYNINGTGINTLNLVGPTPAPTITVSGGLVATINAQILGSLGLTSNGAGTLVLTNAGNSYTGGTTVTGGGAVSVSSDGNLGALAGAVTLNTGTLQTTATFASSRGITVTGTGTLDVTNANVFTANGVVGGTGALTKIDTGTLVLANAGNTYNGPTNIVNGTVQVSANGDLGAVTGGITFGGVAGNNAILQTTAGIAFGNRAVTLNTAGGTVDTNGFNSSLGGVISGAAGNPLTKIGAGTLTVTGASTYIGQTNVNGGTLQVGDGVVVGTQIGNSTAAVVLSNGATLAINLANSGTFGNPVTDNAGSTVVGNNTIGNTQTLTGIISGPGAVTQSGAGTTVLTAANSYNGATLVTAGTLQIGNGIAAGASIANSVSTTVNLGAALAINLANGETFANSVTDNGAVNGVNTGANVQTLAGVISGSGTLNQTGTGTTILTGANSYLGLTTISLGGTLQIGSGGTLGTLGSGNVTDNGALIFKRSNAMTVANTISGGGTVAQQGAGTTILTATNTYSGATTVAFGTLQIGDGATPNASIANTAVTVNLGATLAINLAQNETFVNNVTDNGAVNGISANTQTLSGVIGGSGTLNQNGAGTLILTGSNGYAGTTTISTGTLQVGAAGTTGTLGTGSVTDNAALVFNRSNAITVANAISGSGTLTQQGAGTTTLTGADAYGGVTNVTAGTLQIGDGATGNITSPQINVSGGAALAVQLANNATLTGNVANTGTIRTISANTQTLGGNISGTGVFNQTGTGLTVLTGASTYTGATTVSNGNLRVNGALGNTAVTVQTGATLSGFGSIAGNVTILTGGNLNPGSSPGTLTTGTMVLNAGSNLNFELGTPGVIGQQVLPGNDLVNVNGNLTLDGNLNVTPLAGFGSGSYRLFNYTGTLTNNIVDNITGVGAGFTPLVITSVPQQVILLTLTNGPGPVQFWDGGGLPNDSTVAGGTGNWDGFATNWTNAGGNPNASWQNGRAIFAGTAGTVTAVTPVSVQDMFFVTNGYVVNGANGFGLNLVGPAPAPTINVIAAATATINAQLSGSSGLTSNGAGTLVLTNIGNNYTGGTTITGGGTVSISADGNLGALPGAVDPANITLNNGILQATTTFTLNTNRGITLAGAGGIDVTGTNRFTVGSIIAGPGSLAKTNTGILTLSGVNTYQGGTLVLGGTLEISNNNNLGNVAGGVTFGNGATLKTLAGITSARGFSLDGGAGGGGVIDTNTFNSTLTGVITGAAANGLVKNGAGILTVTGTSTYLGTTTINAGTLQVGDGLAVNSQIGNNAANVVVNNGGTLAVNLANNGIFANPVTDNLNGAVNGISSNTQTLTGVISGQGVVNQNGTGKTILTATNTYTGATTVNQGTLQIGDGTTVGSSIANSVSTTVIAGANLSINLANNGIFTNSVTDNGAVNGISANTQTLSGVIGGPGVLNQTGTGITILTGNNSYGGITTISAGTLQVGNGGISGSLGSAGVTDNSNLVFKRSDAIVINNLISGTGTLSQNGTGVTTLTAANTYSGLTTVNSGELDAANNSALGANGAGAAGSGTVVMAGATLRLLNGIAIGNEALTINGTGVGGTQGALAGAAGGTESYAGVVTVQTSSTVNANGGTMTFTGGFIKAGVNLTFNGGGTVNINTTGISGAPANSDLIVDSTTMNENVANSYNGQTFIRSTAAGTGIINANVAGALPTTAVIPRSAVTMDDSGLGGSVLNIGGTVGFPLGASQSIASLVGAVTSKVTLGANTLTIGFGTAPDTNGIAGASFAGVISGAGGITKDETSTQILAGINTYTGATTVNGGTLQAGSSQAFGVNSPVTVGAGGIVELAGFSNTIGSLTGAATAAVQNTLATGGNNPTVLTLAGTNVLPVTFAGIISQAGAGAPLGLVKNGAGTQSLSGSNTYSGGTILNAGQLNANVAPGATTNTAFGTGLLTINGGTLGSTVANETVPNNVLVNGSFSVSPLGNQGSRMNLSGDVNLGASSPTITNVTGLGETDLTGVVSGTSGVTFASTAGLGGFVFGDMYNPANPANANANTYAGLTTISANTGLGLAKADGVIALPGSALISPAGSLALFANDQIAHTATITDNSTGNSALGANFAGFFLNGKSATIAALYGTGTVQLDNQPTGGTTAGILTVGAGNFSGVIFDNGHSGQLVKNTPGTLLLSGANTYVGNTTINGGSLIVDGSIASANTFVNPAGLLGGHGFIGGNVVNAGIVSPGNSPGTLTVKGNYFQTGGGTLLIEVAGKAAGQHDLLAVGGNANLNGNLRILNTGSVTLKRGDQITFLTAAGGVKGTFSHVDNGFATGNPLLDAHVVYHPDFVDIELLQGSFAGLSSILGLTPNQIAVARALDKVARNPKLGAVLDYLDNERLAKIPHDLDLIAPEEFASIFTLGTSLANVQSANLSRRMDDLHAGSHGFSSSGYAVSGSLPETGGDIATTPGGLSGPAGKGGKEIVAPAEDRMGVFITGAGEFTNILGTYNARGFDLTTGGFTLGADYRVTEHFAIGLMTGYANTSVDLNAGGRISVDGAKIGLYATYFDGGFYVDSAVTGGYNSYDTRRTALQGTAFGRTTGGELNAMMSTGYDWKVGALTVGPVGSVQYTTVGIGKFTEHCSLLPLNIAGQSRESLRTALGFKASYDLEVAGVVIKPELRAAWQHEFGDVASAVDSSFANVSGSSFTVHGPELGRDSMLLGAGFAVLWNERTSTYIYYDGELLKTNANSQNVSGGVRVSF